MTRAEGAEGSPGSRVIVRVGVVCLLVILVVGGYNVLASNVLHGPVNGRSLYLSVKRESGGGSFTDAHRECRREPNPRVWLCDVEDPGGSAGGATYRVRVRPGSSCWRGRADVHTQGLPRRISGCVYRRE
jgi:hypothetical protein